MKAACLKTALILTLIVSLTSCSIIPDRFIIFKKPLEETEEFVAVDDGDFFVAISVSGGGSRAAVWSSSVLSELYKQVKLPDGRSILDEVDYISSVSGGSVSSAYYCMRKPTTDTRDTGAYDAFFESYTADMRRNFEKEIVSIYKPWQWHRIFLRATDKGVLLQKTFDNLLFNKKDFYDLYNRQVRRESPTLIINGTSMDNGSKFLFTTLGRRNFTFDPLTRSRFLEKSGIEKSNILIVRRRDQGVMFARDIGLSIGGMRISKAVTASAGVPLLFGPVILKGKRGLVPGRSIYTHVNDGGVADNLGLETVIQLMSKRFGDKKKRYRGGLVIIIDAAHPIDPEDTKGIINAFSSMGALSRSLDIFDYRYKYFAYYTILLIQQDDAFKDIRFVYISPYLVDDPEITSKVKAVGTRFMIEPELAENLDLAAKMVIGDLKERILLNLEGKDCP